MLPVRTQYTAETTNPKWHHGQSFLNAKTKKEFVFLTLLLKTKNEKGIRFLFFVCKIWKRKTKKELVFRSQIWRHKRKRHGPSIHNASIGYTKLNTTITITTQINVYTDTHIYTWVVCFRTCWRIHRILINCSRSPKQCISVLLTLDCYKHTDVKVSMTIPLLPLPLPWTISVVSMCNVY